MVLTSSCLSLYTLGEQSMKRATGKGSCNPATDEAAAAFTYERARTVKVAPMGHLSATLGHLFCPLFDFDADKYMALK